jgi:hypothetical protein
VTRAVLRRRLHLWIQPRRPAGTAAGLLRQLSGAAAPRTVLASFGLASAVLVRPARGCEPPIMTPFHVDPAVAASDRQAPSRPRIEDVEMLSRKNQEVAEQRRRSATLCVQRHTERRREPGRPGPGRTDPHRGNSTSWRWIGGNSCAIQDGRSPRLSRATRTFGKRGREDRETRVTPQRHRHRPRQPAGQALPWRAASTRRAVPLDGAIRGALRYRQRLRCRR